ncbi:MAG: ChpI protein [Deinococcota bacterium]
MKTAISIPDPQFAAAEQLAKRLGLSRSELYQHALAEFIDRHDQDCITDMLNHVYDDSHDSVLEPYLAAMQKQSLSVDEW